jgi:hypothetical protein
MRRRAIGAALLIVGGLAVLFAPWRLDAVSDSSGPFGSESRLDLIYWPPGWYWVHLPILIIGVVFVVTGLILVSTRPEPRRWRGDLRGFVVFGRSGGAQATWPSTAPRQAAHQRGTSPAIHAPIDAGVRRESSRTHEEGAVRP